MLKLVVTTLAFAVAASCQTTPAVAHSAEAAANGSFYGSSAVVTADVVDFSPLEAAVLREINTLRADPAAYASVVGSWRGQFEGKHLKVASEGKIIATQEGEAAVVEAVDVVGKAPRAQTLVPSAGLARAAADHVKSQGATRLIGHRGDDGSNSLVRITRHGRSSGRSAEVIDYGWRTPREIVIDLLVDDGIADRGHRRALLDPIYAQAGVSCGPHARYGVMCVVEMAESYVSTPTTGNAIVAEALQ